MSDFESGAREQIRYAVTGEHDLTATAMTELPHGGNPTGPSKDWTSGPTDEVVADMTVRDNIAQTFQVPVSITNVLRYGIYDLPMQSVYAANWTAAFTTGVVATLATEATGNKVTSSGTSFAALAPMLPCHVWICRNGADEIAGQPALALSTTDTNTKLVLATAANGGITLTDVAEGDDMIVMHSGVLKNGTTHIFGLLERAQLGLGHYHAAFGVIATQFSLNIQKGQNSTQTITFKGLDSTIGTATFGTSVVDAVGTPSMNGGSQFKYFREGGAANASLFVQACTLQVNADATAIDPAGMDGPYAHQKNRFAITGQVTYYSNDEAKAVAEKANARTVSSLQFGQFATDESGVTSGYMHWLPSIQYDKTNQDGGGAEGVLMTPTPWSARRHPTYGVMACCTRFANVPLVLP